MMCLPAGLGLLRPHSSTPPSSTTWNPSDKASEIDLDGLLLTATRNATNNNQWRLVRSTIAHDTGKYYAEIENQQSQMNGLMIGLSPGSLSVNTYPGSSADSFGYHCNDSSPGYCYNNGSQFFGDGQVVGNDGRARIAVDFDAGRIWLGNLTTWKNGGDPAAGTSPTFTFTPNTELFIAAGMYIQFQQAWLRVTGFSGSVPTGFSAW
jgi:hypothetical protein